MAGDVHKLEIYTDSCEQVPGALAAPLPTLVSGAAAKWRPNHPAFMEQQNIKYPELTTVWSDGPTWGFMYVELDEDTMKIDVISPETDFSGGSSVLTSVSFPRRSGQN